MKGEGAVVGDESQGRKQPAPVGLGEPGQVVWISFQVPWETSGGF